MPQMDFGVRVAMVLFVVLLLAAVFAYHVWLDRLYVRRPRADAHAGPPVSQRNERGQSR